MADVNQLYTVLNSVAQQALGESAVAVTDTTSMVSLGDAVLSSSANKDAFVGALMDRIGRTIVSMRAYNPDRVDPLVKKPFDYGCVLQKIYIDLEDASANNEWNIGSSSYSPSFAPVSKPSVSQKLFNSINTWEFDWSVPDNILRTAFVSETDMQAFFTAQAIAMDNSLMLSMENAGNLVRATAAAYHVNNAGATAINLLSEYNTAAGTSLTVNDCMLSVEFLRYAAKRITDTAKRMARMSRLFNLESFARHTPSEELVITLLQEFDSAESMYLQSDTFHDELVKMPKYNVVPYWQGSGTSYAFSDTSKIDITIEVDGTDTEVAQSGILCMIHDTETIGTTVTELEQSTERNNKDRYTDYFAHANIGYFFDPSENFTVFYVA